MGPGVSQILGPLISNFCFTKLHSTKSAIKGGLTIPGYKRTQKIIKTHGFPSQEAKPFYYGLPNNVTNCNRK